MFWRTSLKLLVGSSEQRRTDVIYKSKHFQLLLSYNNILKYIERSPRSDLYMCYHYIHSQKKKTAWLKKYNMAVYGINLIVTCKNFYIKFYDFSNIS